MALPVLLTAPTASLDADPLNADRCPKRNVALPPFKNFGVTLAAHGGAPSTTLFPSSAHNASDSDSDASQAIQNRALRQWTGAPIRAIVPLPRRKLVVPANTPLPPCPSRAPHLWEDVDKAADIISVDVGGDEIEEEKEGVEGEGNHKMRYCSYESITAAEGLSAWSFEELRVECYAQSLVARGTKPPPVVLASLAIPPAFVPRIIPT